MRFSAVLVAFAATAVSAQVQNYTSSLNMTIDPNSVSQQQRAVWCQAQTNTCQTLCDNNPNTNDCSQADLSYDCTCASNNSAPGLQYYTQTLPTFICQQLFSNCIQQNVGSQSAQKACQTNIEALCGTVNPPSDAAVASSTTTGSASSTAAPTATATATGSGTAKAPSSSAFAVHAVAPAGQVALTAAALGLLAYLI